MNVAKICVPSTAIHKIRAGGMDQNGPRVRAPAVRGEWTLPPASRSTPRNAIGSLVLIAAIVAVAAAAFAYTGGWFSPERFMLQKLVDGFDLRLAPPLGHRRNHAKGIASRACSS